MALGNIYVMRHPSREAGFKVGKTAREVEDRLRELNSDSTLVGGTMELIGYWVVENMDEAEKAAHHALRDFRKQANREFFVGTQEEIYKGALSGIEKSCVLKEVGFEGVQKGRPSDTRSPKRRAAVVDFRIKTESDARFVINEEYRCHVNALEKKGIPPLEPKPYSTARRSLNRRTWSRRPSLEDPMEKLVEGEKSALFCAREAERIKPKAERFEAGEGGGLPLRYRSEMLNPYARARFRANESVYSDVQSDIEELATTRNYFERLEVLAYQKVLLRCFGALKKRRPTVSLFDYIFRDQEAKTRIRFLEYHDKLVEAVRRKLAASSIGLSGESGMLKLVQEQEDAVEAAYKKLASVVDRRESKREEETVRRWLGSPRSWKDDPLRPQLRKSGYAE